MLSFYEELKKIFFNNLDIKCVTDHKQLWKTVKSCLTDKALKEGRLTLTENEKVVSDERELVKIFKWILFKYCIKLRYSTPSKYYPSPYPGGKCIKKNLKITQVS